ncbi:hypothetical protein [Oceanobacillus caeni]|uniref:hypothetical protein n=1 Tax=Oceanobacillus caeni TaxID=405946 RepID=UPI002E1F4115|nr:hypothetical protein [Oceanobacillus caeni]
MKPFLVILPHLLNEQRTVLVVHTVDVFIPPKRVASFCEINCLKGTISAINISGG